MDAGSAGAGAGVQEEEEDAGQGRFEGHLPIALPGGINVKLQGGGA